MPGNTTPPTAAQLRDRASGQTIEQHLDAVRDAQSAHLAAMQDVVDGAAIDGRESLRASEQRTVDRHDDEVRRLGILARTLENSPEAQQIDYRQLVGYGTGAATDTTTRDDVPLLARDASFADWTTRHAGGYRPDDAGVRLGALVRAWTTGRRDGLNDAEVRAMGEGTASAGGVLVPTPTAANFIDAARAAARVFESGATTVPMDRETLKVPRLTGTSAPAWRSEHAAVAEGDLTLDAVTLRAGSMSFLVKVSRELVEDSAPSILGVLEHDLAAQVALELDRVALRGSGVAPEPGGVLNATGVTVEELGSGNGLPLSTGTPPPAYDPLMDAVQAVRAANFEPNAFILAPRTETSLGKSRDTEGRYIQPPMALDGIPRLPTNQVPTDLTVGTSTDCSEIYTGQWPMLYVGIRTGPLMIQLVERYADFGQIALMVWMRADVQLAQPAAFHVATGVRT